VFFSRDVFKPGAFSIALYADEERGPESGIGLKEPVALDARERANGIAGLQVTGIYSEHSGNRNKPNHFSFHGFFRKDDVLIYRVLSHRV